MLKKPTQTWIEIDGLLQTRQRLVQQLICHATFVELLSLKPWESMWMLTTAHRRWALNIGPSSTT
eukprot:8488885-Karenia_brevis.AAC.1